MYLYFVYVRVPLWPRLEAVQRLKLSSTWYVIEAMLFWGDAFPILVYWHHKILHLNSDCLRTITFYFYTLKWIFITDDVEDRKACTKTTWISQDFCHLHKFPNFYLFCSSPELKREEEKILIFMDYLLWTSPFYIVGSTCLPPHINSSPSHSGHVQTKHILQMWYLYKIFKFIPWITLGITL